MSTLENQIRSSETAEVPASARSHRIVVVAWLAGVTAVVALGTMDGSATVGTGLGVIGVSGMITIVSWLILKAR
jgi:hypothetical protein